MKDASPRIFRKLENIGGRDGFDTIVGAAVLSYGSLRAPNDVQARDFARLVAPLWDKVSAETRRSLAAALSNSPRVPREIVERLIAEPIEVCAPFLMSSPALGEADLKAIALSHDRRLRRLVAERRRAPKAVSHRGEAPAPDRASATSELSPLALPAPPLPTDDAAPGDACEQATPQDGARLCSFEPNFAFPAGEPAIHRLPAPPLVPNLLPPSDDLPAFDDRDAPVGARPPARGAAALVRETLRRLALPGRRQSAAGPAPTLRELVVLSTRQDAGGFYDGLGRMLALPPERIDAIARDATGERLAVAVKALGASPADALTMLMMMKPSIGLDVEAFGRMTRYYRALKTADCETLARGTQRRPEGLAPALQPQYQDIALLPRAEPRPTFGRRKTLPNQTERGRDSG